MLLAIRDLEDAESLVAVQQKLEALARRLLAPRPLTAQQQQRLRRLSRSAKASEITRKLQGWRFRLSDVTVRRLQRDSHIFHFTWR